MDITDEHRTALVLRVIPGHPSIDGATYTRLQPQCDCGWVGDMHVNRATADHEADDHIQTGGDTDA